MQPLTPRGNAALQDLAQRHGVSVDAARTLLFAVAAGGGAMAQFYHPELGGGGQWMRGGMTMVGDMFNHGLQATVAGLCSDLSTLLSAEQVFEPLPQSLRDPAGFGGWWPVELGQPSSSGGQNDSRYAYFPRCQRLAIDRGGRVSVYDTLDHQIGGVQQQQGGPSGSLSFSSQFGTFTVDSLPLADQRVVHDAPLPAQATSSEWRAPNRNVSFSQTGSSGSGLQSHDEILATLERLNDLHQRGILSEDEFRAKKAELLARL